MLKKSTRCHEKSLGGARQRVNSGMFPNVRRLTVYVAHCQIVRLRADNYINFLFHFTLKVQLFLDLPSLNIITII